MQLTCLIISLFASTALAQSGSGPPPAYGASASPTTTSAPQKVATKIGIQCTTYVTAQQVYGCTITAAANQATATVDCAGCILSTSYIQNFFGHGPVCFGGRKTVMDAEATATVHACF